MYKKYSITCDGKKLSRFLYSLDKKNKVFSSKEDDLVLDFAAYDGWTFKVSSGCVLKTGTGCTFSAEEACVFNTGGDCVFKTGPCCVFNTKEECTFETEQGCAFITGGSCIFKTEENCTFETGSECTFRTGFSCMFSTEENCVFETRKDSVLLGYGYDTDVGMVRYRYFLDASRYVFTEDSLIEIKDENAAILNMKHENNFVRKLCREILKGGK